VLIDEAHAMPDETLEEIRLLSNLESNRHKLLQIVLFGQPELDEHLDTAGMRQLKERVTHSFRLEPLVRSDIESYVDFRMRAAGYRGPRVFTRDAIKLIAGVSQGLTRRVNILADKALLAAFAGGTHAVTVSEVKRAVRDSEFYRMRGGTQKIRIGAAALAAGLALGWGTHVLLSIGAPSSAAGPASTGKAEHTVSPAPPQGAIQPQTIAIASPEATSSRPLAPSQGKIAQERFQATQEWLRSTPGDRYAIQLATVDSAELVQLEEFLRKASTALPASTLFVYSVKIDGRQHYRVAYGSYATAAEALEAINGLPRWFSSYRPYYRSVERMRSQNRQ